MIYLKGLNIKHFTLLFYTLFLLIGCGGGSGGSSAPSTLPTDPNPDLPDTAPPIVTLNGAREITVTQYNAYQELGATAYDARDGVLNVVIIGSVDTTAPKTYTLTYRAIDKSGNEGEATRYVTVEAPQRNLTTIHALAIYSSQAARRSADIYTQIEHFVAVSNQISETSQVEMEVILDDAQLYNQIDETAVSTEVLDTIQKDSYIAQVRDSLKADEVFIYRPYTGDGICGIAYINTPLKKSYAYAHISSTQCPTDTTAHELGHNLGLAHSHLQNDGLTGIYSYSYGHLVPNLFGTVMSYASEYNAIVAPTYSNPNLLCNGQPCGLIEGEINAADATRTILQTKSRVAAFN